MVPWTHNPNPKAAPPAKETPIPKCRGGVNGAHSTTTDRHRPKEKCVGEG